jgi:cystathionine gamma-synthase
VHAFAELADLDAAMAAGQGGYRRYGNASVRGLEEALAALEGSGLAAAPVCRVTASGQAALLLAVCLLTEPTRRRIVLLRPCYGGTESLLGGPLSALGAEVTKVDLPPPGEVQGQLDALETALTPETACVVAEVIGNPLVGLLDVPRLTSLCRSRGVASVIDGTFATPFLLRPLELGADAVFHSLSKQLSGHSDVLGGALLLRPDHPAAGRLDLLSRTVGAVMSPFDAFLSLRGLRTAALRVERGAANAAALAEAAGHHPAVLAVHYPGRRSPGEETLAARLLPAGRGSMLSLDVGTRQAAERLLHALPEVRLAPSLGDVTTTVSHPALTSHRSLAAAERRALGIGEGLLRFSVGIEATEDLMAELAVALDALGDAGGTS